MGRNLTDSILIISTIMEIIFVFTKEPINLTVANIEVYITVIIKCVQYFIYE
jgi:hypothetical protein